MLRLGDVELRLVLFMPVDDVPEIPLMPRLARGNVYVLLHGAGGTDIQALQRPTLYIQAGNRVEARAYRTGNNRWAPGGIETLIVGDVVINHHVLVGNTREITGGCQDSLLGLITGFRQVERPTHQVAPDVLGLHMQTPGLPHESKCRDIAHAHVNVHLAALGKAVDEMED